MKKFMLIIIACLLFNANNVNANNPEKEGAKVNLWIPGMLIKIFAGITDDYISDSEIEGKAVLEFASNIGNINVCIREGDYYNVSDAKIERKLNRMEKKEYEELVRIIDDGTQVNISIKQKKNGNIKRLIVLVDEKNETFVYAKINCNLSTADMQHLINNMDIQDF